MNDYHTSIAEAAKTRRRAATKPAWDHQQVEMSRPAPTVSAQKLKTATASSRHEKPPKRTHPSEAIPVLEAEISAPLSRAETPMPILEAMPRCDTPPPYATLEEAKVAQRQSRAPTRAVPNRARRVPSASVSPVPVRSLPVARSLSPAGSGSSESSRASTVSQPSLPVSQNASRSSSLTPRSHSLASPRSVSSPPASASPMLPSPASAASAPGPPSSSTRRCNGYHTSNSSHSTKANPLHTFMRSLHGLRAKTFDTAPVKFTKKFAQEEHLLDNGEAVKVNIWKNGHEFMKSVKEFDEIHLIRSKHGLGMVVPEDLDFDTVTKYISTNNLFSIINSRTQNSKYMDIPTLLEQFKNKGKRPEIWNMLSMEFDQENQELKKAFSVPEFVRKNSIVEKLKKVIEKKIQRINNALKDFGSSQLQAQKKRLEDQLASMPKYQKFLLLSMGDSFTDVHIDFSGTSVYYHVKKGKKIFYVARPTKKNLEVYKNIETGKVTGKWIGEILAKEWRRLEINEGETAMIPSGYLHFVYTPVDSIVIGGNYLREDYMAQQMELTRLEEECVKLEKIKEENMMRGYWNVMWAYLEHILIPQLKDNKKFSSVSIGKLFLENMDMEQVNDEDWYEQKEKKDLLDELKNLMPSERKRLRSQSVGGETTVVKRGRVILERGQFQNLLH